MAVFYSKEHIILFLLFEMDTFMLRQRSEIFKTYFQSEHCVAKVMQILKRMFGWNEARIASAVHKFLKNVRKTSKQVNNRSSSPARTVHKIENTAANVESVWPITGTPSRHSSQEFNISRYSLRRIMYRDLEIFS